jgi:hypothetical protein
MLTYYCPETKNLVRTSIETSEEQLQRLGRFKHRSGVRIAKLVIRSPRQNHPC